MSDKKYLTFSGIPVVCSTCGKQVEKENYQKQDGKYLCPECAKK